MWEGLGLRIMLMCLWVGISLHAHTTLDHTHQKHLPLHRHRERSKEGQVLHRTKRGWVWNQFFVIEEYTGPDPVLVGRLHSDVDSGNGNIKYVLSGEGAGTIFVIDDKTGNIHATKTLDREEQAQYTLIAQAVARDTNKPLEPPSQFVVKVQDINDNPPEFLNGPYYASVPEMAGVGTSVIQVTATDADDPTYGNSAMLVYSILQGQPYFSVDPQTGIIRTALPNMDREARQEYDVVIQAKDMGGHMGGLSGTTEVKIVLTDVNDNPPKFPQSVYSMSISEDKVPGEEVGRLKAKDPDLGENGLVTYSLIEGNSMDVFEIVTDSRTQEGIIKLQKAVDFESKRAYTLRVEASNVKVDPHFFAWGPFKDTVTVKVTVEDEDEPPVFTASGYNFEVEENAPEETIVGRVHAKDTDMANKPIRYMIPRYIDLERFFIIDPEYGIIRTTRPLDRESLPWHNISVSAIEIGGHHQDAKVRVNIKVRDVNDNAPELASQNEILLCENVAYGKMIEIISAMDKDEMAPHQHFRFSISPEATGKQNFTVKDNRNSTASLYVTRKDFSKTTQDVYLLPIRISDSGSPPMSSTSTVILRVCSCDARDTILSCNAQHFILPAGLSMGALIAILACIVVLLAIVVLFVALHRQKNEPLMVFKEEDIRENIITYDDEGGGEADTEAFDIATLQNPDGANGFLPRKDMKPELQYPVQQRLEQATSDVDVNCFIRNHLCDVDNDPNAPPYDSIQVYGYEGQGSVAGSLSSLETTTNDSDLNYDYLQIWGPPFKKLADLYGTKDSVNNKL
ncbi:cadherin-11-like isoform X1 [Brienomyrus brachyistius]|uniref:cadherin-11-like isoform X1 n=1 Tax=Brienomyrus brachyistius TaxID=42636 RepID=UPI0020B1A93B|nr:cadherin-11-like isoform X1 [Brienomyrus brachyistius]XP_048828020.1 cadherin-11-like isoform X1 [Brienomyrus brachyistius]XP_048828021.1 cadherin-11-like isoform X1 [Brienomyrus brachyistius]